MFGAFKDKAKHYYIVFLTAKWMTLNNREWPKRHNKMHN